MRHLVNIYLLLVLSDGALSLVSELLGRIGLANLFLGWVSDTLFFAAITLSLVLYLLLGVDRRLPKRLFIPLCLYLCWRALALWPLSGMLGREALPLVAAVGQLLLGCLVLALFRKSAGAQGSDAQLWQGPAFSWRNSLIFGGINLLLLPFFLIYSCLATTSYYLEQQTAGFLRLSPAGIHMSERSYRLGDKEIRLAGMMHIGKEGYFSDLAESMSGRGTIILAEGVTDRDHLLEQQFNYSKLAEVIGLASQETMKVDGNLVDLEAFDEASQMTGDSDKPDVARADVDLNRFEPATIDFLNMLGKTLFGDQPLADALAEYEAWAKEHMNAQQVSGILGDILGKRNRAVIGSMARALSYYDTIIIPWGAMHMPAIEAAVLERGFLPVSTRERLSLDFRSLPYAALWQKLSVPASGSG